MYSVGLAGLLAPPCHDGMVLLLLGIRVTSWTCAETDVLKTAANKVRRTKGCTKVGVCGTPTAAAALLPMPGLGAIVIVTATGS